MSNDRILDINPSNEEIGDYFQAACKAMPVFLEGNAGNEVNQWFSDLTCKEVPALKARLLRKVTTSQTAHARAANAFTEDERMIQLYQSDLSVASSELKDVQEILRRTKCSLQPKLTAIMAEHRKEAIALKEEKLAIEKMMVAFTSKEAAFVQRVETEIDDVKKKVDKEMENLVHQKQENTQNHRIANNKRKYCNYLIIFHYVL